MLSSYRHLGLQSGLVLSDFPTNILYTLLINSLITVFSEPVLQTILTFHVPNLISIFLCVGRSKETVQFRVPV